MKHDEFLETVINDGIEAARLSYSKPGDTLKREGALAGFESCRGLDASALANLLKEAAEDCRNSRSNQDPRYWWWRCREAEIEWVCNVISAVHRNQGLPEIICPTARGMLKAAEILGVKK